MFRSPNPKAPARNLIVAAGIAAVIGFHGLAAGTYGLAAGTFGLAAGTYGLAAGTFGLAAGTLVFSEAQEQVLAHIDSLHVSRQVDSTRAYIEPYLEESRAAGDSAFTLPLVAKLGRLWAAFGQPKKGEPLLREAADLATALEDSLRLCDALRWLGFAVEQQGRSTEAVAIYRRQLTIAQARDDRRHEAWARVGLAYRANQEGRYADAAVDYRLAAGFFQDLADTAAAVWTLNGLGAALEQHGEFKEAAACFGQVAELAGQIGYKAVEALAQYNQGSLEYSLGDPGVAMDHFRRAGKLQRQISQRQDAVFSGTSEANCLIHLGRLDEAVVLLTELLRECEEGNFSDRESFVLRVLADVRQMQGRKHEAVAIYRRILARDEAKQDIRDRIQSVTGLAAALADMDSSAAALTVLQQEERRRQGQLYGLSRVELELAFGDRLLETQQPIAALARYRVAINITAAAGIRRQRVDALAGAARCQRELGKPEAALALLRDAAQAWEDTRTATLDPQWREQRGVSGRLVYTQLAALILDGADSDCATTASAFDEVQIFKARTLAERIGGGDRAVSWPVMTLEMLQTKILKNGEVFLDAYLGPTESILFAVTPEKCRAVFLADERTLANRLRLYHELLATPPPANDLSRALDVVEAAGERLGRELLGPIAPLLSGCRRVVFAPDGPLNLVPLVTLVRPRSPETCPVLVRVPSATILGFLRTSADTLRVRGQGILAVAAAETPEGRPLPGAVREVRHLARRYSDVDLRLAGSSGAALVPADLTRYDILHLATHARVDDQRPWSSEIVLNTKDPTGRLRAGLIAELDLSARLAVLSACETGSGRILSGEGVLGLSSAFLSAGVPTVVASLWPVADSVTTVLMEKFYEELASGRDPSTALALAQDAIRADPVTAHPFHWAGFVVVGDGTVAVDLQVKRRLGPVALFLVAVFVAVVVTFTVRRRFRKTGG